MKKLKIDHESAELVRKGQKSTTWRLFDDKDLSVDDKVLLIDKVEPENPNTWKDMGVATINSVVQKRLKDITETDMDQNEELQPKEELLANYRRHYGGDVTWQTPVKIIHFTFSPELPTRNAAEILSKIDKAIVYADGGSRGNPGPSASGYVIFDENKTPLVHRGIYLGITTNNQAEYTALKLALEEVRSLGAQEVDVYMDSMLVINQMKGVFKVKNRDLWPIHDVIKQLSAQFKHITYTQIPRELNKLADAAVNKALDEQMKAISSR